MFITIHEHNILRTNHFSYNNYYEFIYLLRFYLNRYIFGMNFYIPRLPISNSFIPLWNPIYKHLIYQIYQLISSHSIQSITVHPLHDLCECAKTWKSLISDHPANRRRLHSLTLSQELLCKEMRWYYDMINMRPHFGRRAFLFSFSIGFCVFFKSIYRTDMSLEMDTNLSLFSLFSLFNNAYVSRYILRTNCNVIDRLFIFFLLFSTDALVSFTAGGVFHW